MFWLMVKVILLPIPQGGIRHPQGTVVVGPVLHRGGRRLLVHILEDQEGEKAECCRSGESMALPHRRALPTFRVIITINSLWKSLHREPKSGPHECPRLFLHPVKLSIKNDHHYQRVTFLLPLRGKPLASSRDPVNHSVCRKGMEMKAFEARVAYSWLHTEKSWGQVSAFWLRSSKAQATVTLAANRWSCPAWGGLPAFVIFIFYSTSVRLTCSSG